LKGLPFLPILAALLLILSGCAQKEASAPATPSSTQAAAPTQSADHTHATSSAPAAGGTKEIKVTAKNFEFEPAEVHVNKGDKVKIIFENKEGAHGFSIPDYKVDLKLPGNAEFVADRSGTFPFACSVICGVGHAKMAGKLVVD
jgi:cytochrome c oxidase subunit II